LLAFGRADSVGPTFYPNSTAIHEGYSHFSVGRIQYAAEGSPGNSHTLGSFLLVEVFHVSQSEGFQLLDGDDYLLQSSQRHGPRLEVINTGHLLNELATGTTWQWILRF